MWDPETYRKFGEQRSRPFFELVARVGASAPGFVADLGCGPGELTAELCARWPGADVLGVDSSPEMIEAARRLPARSAADQGGPGDAASTVGPVSSGRPVSSVGRASPGSTVGPVGSGRPVSSVGHASPASTVGPVSSGRPVSPAGPQHSSRPGPRLRFELADVRDWQPDRPPDVIVSNALLQWVPDHERLLVRWASQLAPGGWLAFAVPANFGQPGHTIMRELAATARWQRELKDVEFNRQTADPAAYLDVLAGAGCEADAWETTYLHVLDGEDAVLRWYEGTGLRPVLAALTPDEATEFTAEYGARLRDAYPRRAYGTVLPFRRVFTVARRPG